jgi:hypothetical protein
VIQDLFLRWIVTTLFVISAAECVHGIFSGRLSWTVVVGKSLHALMAIAMAVMAWPSGADLPTTGPLLFFLSATVWFVVITLGHPKHRHANLYHAMMMLAMAWMYTTMSGMPAMTAAHGAIGTPSFITGLNWLFTIGFAVAGGWWLWWLFVRRRSKPVPSGGAQVGIAAQAVMAAGTAIMFAVML